LLCCRISIWFDTVVISGQGTNHSNPVGTGQHLTWTGSQHGSLGYCYWFIDWWMAFRIFREKKNITLIGVLYFVCQQWVQHLPLRSILFYDFPLVVELGVGILLVAICLFQRQRLKYHDELAGQFMCIRYPGGFFFPIVPY
jgi:hypothetical protein